MKAFEAINSNGVFLYVGQTVSEAARLLIERDIIAAPVLDDRNQCVGSVSKDTLLASLLQGLPADTDISQIMRSEFNILNYDDEIIIEYDKLPEVILVEREGTPAGVIDYPYLMKLDVMRVDIERAKFKASVDAVFTPVMAVDNEGRIKIFNKWMSRLLDIDQKNALEVLAGEVIANKEILDLLKEDPIYTDMKITIKGNTFIPYSKDILVSNERVGRVLLLRDISEIEQLVKESEYTKRLNQQLEAIIESSFDGLYVTDGQANTLRLNKGFERIMGIKAEQCVGRNMRDLVREGVFSRSGTLAAIDKGASVTLSLTASTGKEALVTSNPIYDEEGNMVLCVTNVRDITELNELERKLEHVEGLREREMGAVIESMFDGLYVTDGQANTLRINKGFERIMGIKAEQCEGRNMRDLVREGVFSRSGTLVALETGTRATISLTSSTGKEALVTSNPIYDEEGKIIMVVTNVRDITELNSLQRRLERVEGLQELYKTELMQMKLESSHGLIMTSAKMKELISMVLRIAAVDSTVLIQGESGVGKELIAEIIHSHSKCKEGPFVRVNCGAIPENLLESELFGYESGAFTGASKGGKLGLFELARGGIIFLDEIGELPLNLQVKLLRVLQDRTILRVGGTGPIKIDCRVLAGTNRDLRTMIDNNEFRLDLFYRLNVIPVTIPPLRERQEDIPVLINHFLNTFNLKYGMNKRLDTVVYNTLAEYSWPGNVRELENLMERLVVTCINNIITVNDLPLNILNDLGEPQQRNNLMPLKEALENTERDLLEKAFATYRSSYQIAEVLEVNQSTVVRKAQKYGIKH
ncbi:MAG: sigma 54-interacting transcriptional regulator [Syntrophomonadaceae bacterium]|nr:sigma 54-interacting transcriptional regulator [Syntrophomonadaceae bacterium]